MDFGYACSNMLDRPSGNSTPERPRGWALGILACAFVLIPAGRALAFRALDLSAAEKAALKRDFAPCLSKLKGPYSENFCVCRKTGEKRPVMDKSGRITSPCGNDDLFCAAFRAPWAESLGKQRMWVANIFSRDLWLWDSFPDHHDLVRGYILEKYFVETNPKHKLAELRAYGGLSGSEYEVGASTAFFERYLGANDFDPTKHFPLAYELQRRFFVRDDVGQVQKVRNMAVRVQNADAKFKPLRDAIHNQISAGLIPKVAAYRDQLPAGAERSQVEDIITEIQKLTALDEGALRSQLAAISGDREKLAALVPDAKTDPVEAITRLSELMVLARETVAARRASVPDQRKLIDLDITAAAVLQQRGNALLEAKPALSVKQYVQLLRALTDAAYGAGLLVEREHEAADTALQALAAEPRPSRQEFARRLKQAERVVEWAQANAVLSYAEVWAPWTFLLPQVASIGDDVLRGSPLLLYAQVARRLDDYAAGSAALHHDFFGAEVTTDVRALNSGLALGRLRVAPKDGVYTRDEIVALPETPADLEPAAGILTQGEGNILSHLQLLARALGIPNVVLGPSAFARLKPHDGENVFLIATPGGRVIVKQASAMSAEEHRVYDEYTRNDTRSVYGTFGGGGDQKLHIDPSRIDLSRKLPIDLTEVRRSDSGKLSGPKGAFLGELKHLFPDHVARGIVVPFGAYHQHYENAPVAVPAALKSAGIASAGERLPDFVERTYKEFFEKLIPAKTPERELSAWIAPRLEIIRNSIEAAPLAPELRQAIRDGLDHNGLLDPKDRTRSVGCFVRSDTNVEDLDNFNGAGLNLTIFNLVSLDDIERGLKKVWASPFELRSFSWRQTLIDQPLWVLPSVVILESVPNEKSGVLVTADVATGDPSKMTVATSEGVGGAVDGTSAETLLWSPQSVEIVTLFKSPWRNALQPSGGSKIVPSTGRDHVLEPDELKQITDAGRQISEKLEPARDPAGKPRPWDIEFGFRQDKLWLFQSRPFIGNDNLKNVPALTALEGPAATANAKDTLSLEEILR